jgi:hypothetical protein
MIPLDLQGAHGSFALFGIWAMGPLDSITPLSIMVFSNTKR